MTFYFILFYFFKAEESKLVKMSKLNETAVYPKPIERQRV